MATTIQDVKDALARVSYPGFRRDVISLGVLKELKFESGIVDLLLDLGAGNPAVRAPLEASIVAALSALDGVKRVQVRFRGGSRQSAALKMAGSRPSVAAAGSVDPGMLAEVRHTIAVASGKGGVGKSTIAVNLAVALARQGARTGLLDADIYGPSIPLMMGIDAQPQLNVRKQLVPFERFGVRLMSLGFLVDREAAVIWRGPMVMKAIDQLLRDVVWGALDYLVVDLPPGTGDAQLTLSQKVRLSGAVIVTTPQDVALADARKGVAMFNKVDVPVLGIVENMSYFQCPHCSARTEIFGHGGGRREAERLGVACLGQIPLDPAIRTGGDAGQPVVDSDPDSPQAQALGEIATRVRGLLDGESNHAAPPGSVFDRFRKIWNRPPG